jgi:hypothetical protein
VRAGLDRDLADDLAFCSGRAVVTRVEAFQHRLTLSMSATLPVSFQNPVMTLECTVLPWSMSHWIASVISSSPRQEGLRSRAASWMAGVQRPRPDRKIP